MAGLENNAPLRILHLEDNENDSLLIQRVLQKEEVKPEITTVSNRADFLAALDQGKIDLILADHRLPTFDGSSALNIAREKNPELPFIFVTGSMDEDLAIETFKQGATDYVLKSRLGRLGPAVRRALQEAEQRRATTHATLQWKETEARFSAFMNNSPTVAFMKNSQGRYVYINRTFEKTFCTTQHDLLGKTAYEWLPKEVADQTHEHDLAVLTAGRGQELIEHIPAPDGSMHEWMVFKFPFTDTTGETFLGGVAIDITEKKLLEAQFLRAQRMESIGILAGGIAHDLNNVLAPILMVAQLMRLKPLDEESSEWLDTLESSANHGADLIKQILAFSRGIEGERIDLQVGHLIRDLQKMMQETFPRTIAIRANVASGLWTINAVATHLKQVLMNLAVNARDAMPDGGQLEIKAENVTIDEGYVLLHPDAAEGRYVIISVTDTGTGISDAIIQKIYDPFFSTKEIGKGTGLGLSTVKGIIKNHHGFIHVYSEAAKGTTFKVYFPASATHVAHEEDSRKPTIPRGRGELILVVDDEAPVRDLVKVTLEKFGYQVVTANDGVDGLATYVEMRDKISVILTDMMMPHMEGQAMIRALLKISSSVKIIALSGHFDEQKIVSLRETGRIKFLEKPFAAEELLMMVAGELKREA